MANEYTQRLAALLGAVKEKRPLVHHITNYVTVNDCANIALALGASAVLCEHAPEEAGPWIVVPDARAALAAVSANWFGRPADRLTALAVTGTNGKTTTT